MSKHRSCIIAILSMFLTLLPLGPSLSSMNCTPKILPQSISRPRASAGNSRVLYNVSWGGAYSYDIEAMVLNNSNSIYIAGRVPDGTPAAMGFVAKFDLNGTYLWNATYVNGSQSYGQGLAVDLDNNAYLVGYTYAGTKDVFIAKYSTSGLSLWNTTWSWNTTSLSSYDFATAAAANGSDYVYVAGYTNTHPTGGNNYDIFLLKLDSSGNYVWNRTCGSPSTDYANAVTTDTNGNIYIAGDIYNGSNQYDAFVAKYDPDGNQIWNTTYGNSTDQKAYGIVLDNDGNVIITGQSGTRGFVAKFDPLGSIIENYNSTYVDFFSTVQVDQEGQYYLAGQYYDGSSTNAIALCLNSTFQTKWNVTYATPEYDYGIAALVDNVSAPSFVYFAGGNGSASGDVFITKCYINAPPYLVGSGDKSVLYGATGININWTIWDEDTNNSLALYRLFRDDVEIASGSWKSGDTVGSVVSTIIALGDHNYTLAVWDGLGAHNQHEIWITLDNVNPILSVPQDLTFPFNASVADIAWSINDTSTATTSYSIYGNGSILAIGTWVHQGSIAFSPRSLGVGYHNISLVAEDGVGGNATDSVEVIVTNDRPQFTFPADIAYTEGFIGMLLSWTVVDLNINETAATYIIYRNDSVLQTGIWISGKTITINVDGLLPGIYEYRIIALDGLGASGEDVAIITVIAEDWVRRVFYWVLGGVVSAAAGMVFSFLLKRFRKRKNVTRDPNYKQPV